MIGNVWEWTTDRYVPKHPAESMKACGVPRNRRGHVGFRCIVRSSGAAAIESHRT
jgi:formylglycine-generating enzyme required for sulfatase activity